MNTPSLPTFDHARLAATEAKHWWHAPLKPNHSTTSPDDPEIPRALWRLIDIAEMAGLLVSSNKDALLRAFRAEGPMPTAIKVELDRFRCSLTDLYVVVTLFSAAPCPVPLEILARETFAEALSLRRSLDHLDGIEAISAEATATGKLALELTSSGLNFAVLLTYRVINASCEGFS